MVRSGKLSVVAIRISGVDDCVAVPWRNGRGTMRTLAEPEGGAGEPAWRVSIADVEGRSQFSRFPGFDRVTVACGPGTEQLVVDGATHVLRHGEVLHYGGEQAVESSVTTPMRNLNLFARRAAWSIGVAVRHGGHEVELGRDERGDHHVCVLLDSHADVTDGGGAPLATLDPLGFVWVDDGDRVSVASSGTLVVAVFTPA